MYWNYRIVRTTYDGSNGEPKSMWQIYEVYYDEDGTPMMRTIESVAPMLGAYEEDENVSTNEEAKESMLTVLRMVIEDLEKKDVLDDEDIAYNRMEQLNEEVKENGITEIPFKED